MIRVVGEGEGEGEGGCILSFSVPCFFPSQSHPRSLYFLIMLTINGLIVWL